MKRKRGKTIFQRHEVWEILEEFADELKARCEDNEIMREEIAVIMDNFEL
jgi:hypothetical protein